MINLARRCLDDGYDDLVDTSLSISL